MARAITVPSVTCCRCKVSHPRKVSVIVLDPSLTQLFSLIGIELAGEFIVLVERT